MIDHERPLFSADEGTTAIFYSINNCHTGLRGISFGNFLIKQVILELKRELPKLKTFATLSPIPLFRDWLSTSLEDPDSDLVTSGQRDCLQRLDTQDWQHWDSELKLLLLRLAARYLLEAKRGDYPHDPVARFHLRNGARLERINWRGDVSENGVSQSAGMLVNYVYDLRTIEMNHEDHVTHRKIAASPRVKRLLRA